MSFDRVRQNMICMGLQSWLDIKSPAVLAPIRSISLGYFTQVPTLKAHNPWLFVYNDPRISAESCIACRIWLQTAFNAKAVLRFTGTWLRVESESASAFSEGLDDFDFHRPQYRAGGLEKERTER